MKIECTPKKMIANARKTFRQKRRESFRNYVSSINSRTPTSKVFNMIRKMTGKFVRSPLHHLKNNQGQLLTDKHDIADALADKFRENSSAENYSQDFQSYKSDKEKQKLNFKTRKKFSYNKKFSLRDLKRSLRKAKDSSPGPDIIHYQILKHLPDETLKVLLELINQHWVDGTFPESWRKALIVPIPKPGKDHFDPTNYRPIALTSCICKSVERMVNERLVHHLEKNNLLTKLQCGFRAGRSTIDQLIRMESFVRDAFANKHHLIAVFFDLKKAYDTTWKYGIMKDLHDMGLRGNLPIFIQNFLCDRVFSVIVANSLSDECIQEEGVPQGAILSTTLFNIKLNGIVAEILPGVDCSLYVDDFVIIISSRSLDTVQRRTQLAINKLQKWTFKNGFTISTEQDKTVAMHFCKRRNCHEDPYIHLNNIPIKFVQKKKFLGLIWDPKLKFKHHVDYLRKKCFKALNIIKILSHKEWGSDTKLLLQLYQSLIQSKLDYGSIVYHTALIDDYKLMRSLEVVHNQGLRYCLGAFKSSRIESLNAEANTYPLRFRREKLALQYGVKIKSNPDNAAYDCIFKSRFHAKYTGWASTEKFSMFFLRKINEANISLNDIRHTYIPNYTLWESVPVKVNFEMTQFDKKITSPQVIQAAFNEILVNYQGYCHIYTDGSKANERSASAVYSPVANHSFRVADNSTPFTAEIEAIQSALMDCDKTRSHKKFVIFSDSLSFLQTIAIQDTKNPLALQVLDLIQKILSPNNKREKWLEFCWIPSHKGIKGNEVADKMAKEALNKPTSTRFKVPYTDKNPQIKAFINAEWQQYWGTTQMDNKLYAIMPTLTEYDVSNLNRKEQVLIHRIRIGHTRLTHGYLMDELTHAQPPQCFYCNIQTTQIEMTVEHLMIHCTAFSHIRNQIYNVPNMKTLFDTVSAKKIIRFVKEAGFYQLF